MMKRRDFFKAAAAGSALPVFAQSLPAQHVARSEQALGSVKIIDVKTATIRLGYYDAVLVKVITDQGIYGLGETYPRTAGVYANLEFVKQALIGEEPLHVEYLYHRMLEYGRRSASYTGSMAGAIAGIETALWDLAGKILGVPVYTLLGGKFHDRLLIYHDTSEPKPDYLDPQGWLKIAKHSVDYGFQAIKFDFSHRNNPWSRELTNKELNAWVDIVGATRDYLGPEFKFAIDLKYKINVPDAIRVVQALEPFNLWFIEDPLPPHNVASMKAVSEKSKVPIMTGEHFHTRQSWRELIETQACHYIHPDTQKCGGLIETKWIADWADLYYMPMACHNMCTPVGTIASGHLCTATRSFFTLESDSIDLPFWKDLIMRKDSGKFYKDGHLELSDEPGLGVELNEDVCRANLAPGSAFFE